jgi:hypothetical protein
MRQEESEKYLNYEEAALFLGVVRRTVTRYANKKVLTRYVSGVRRRVLFDVEELQKLKTSFGIMRVEDKI